FDVELEIANHIRGESRVRQSCWIKSECTNRRLDRRCQRSIQITDNGTATNKWNPEAHTFFFREPHHFYSKGRLTVVKLFYESETDEYAQHAVEGTGVGHCIQMRSDHYARGDRWTDCGPKISSCVDG